MATARFDIKFPPRNYIGCDGGLNSKVAKQWILDNESPECLNVIFGPGTVETRLGSTTLNTAAVGSYACDALYTRHLNSGAESMTAWFNGTLYGLSGTSFVPVSGSTGIMTAGVRVVAAEYEEYLFFSNGNTIPYKYAAGELTRHGIYQPTTTSTAGSNASGVCLPSGTYYYKVAYVNSNLVESDVGPVSNAYSVSGGTGIGLTSLPIAAASFGVGYRYIYRSADATSYYKVGTLSNNTATTWADTTTTASVGVAAPTDQGVPPKFKAIVQHNSRLFMISGDDNFVWYTEIGNPYVVKATNFRRIGDQTGEIPTALSVWDNYLLVFCKSGQTWTVYMPSNDDSDWVDFKIRTNFGCKSPKAPFAAMGKVIYPAIDQTKFVGLAAVTAQGSDPEASLTQVGAIGSELMTEMIEPDILNFNQGYVDSIASIVFKNKAYISFTNASLTYNNRILVLDFSNQNISKKQTYTWAPWSGLNISQFCVFEGELYGATSTPNGFVYKLLQSAYSDSGLAINSYYRTKEFTGVPGHETWVKDWRSLSLLYEPSGAWPMGLFTYVDSDLGAGTAENIDLTPGSALWGTMIWETSKWEAGRAEIDLKKALGIYRGKRIAFKFSNLNTVGSKFKIVGISLNYNLKGQR